MKHPFAPYYLALKLKEKRFDEPCLAYFKIEYDQLDQSHNGRLILGENPDYLTSQKKMHYIFGQQICLAPLYQQVTDWFRDNHKITISIDSDLFDEDNIPYFWSNVEYLDKTKCLCNSVSETYNNYYEAYNKAIEEALKLI